MMNSGRKPCRSWIEVFGDDCAIGSAAQDVYTMYSKIVEEDKEDTDLDCEDAEEFEYDPSGGSSQVNSDAAIQSDTPSQGAITSMPPPVPTRPRKRSSSTVTKNSDVDAFVVVLNRLVNTRQDKILSTCFMTFRI